MKYKGKRKLNHKDVFVCKFNVSSIEYLVLTEYMIDVKWLFMIFDSYVKYLRDWCYVILCTIFLAV